MGKAQANQSSQKWTQHFKDHTSVLNTGANKFMDYQFYVKSGGRLEHLEKQLVTWTGLYAVGLVY